MKIGVVFPQIEVEPDVAAIRDYTQTVQELGFSHVLAYDHVLGANPDRPGGWRGPYDYEDPFYSPFLLFSYMTAVSPRLEFVTGIIILPQRETALVAKQAATLDVLCGGKLRLGVGTGWNAVEYVTLNQDFRTRGKRQEEQIEVMQRLWTEPLVTYKGHWHDIPDAGLNPMPVQRPIPIWFGGRADVVLRRAARMGDGYLPNERTAAEARPYLDKLARFLEEEGRDMAQFGLEARMHYEEGDTAQWTKTLEEWREAGATHVSFNTMYKGFNMKQHLEALQRFARAVGLA